MEHLKQTTRESWTDRAELKNSLLRLRAAVHFSSHRWELLPTSHGSLKRQTFKRSLVCGLLHAAGTSEPLVPGWGSLTWVTCGPLYADSPPPPPGIEPASPPSHHPQPRTPHRVRSHARCDRWPHWLIGWWRWLSPRAAAPGSNELTSAAANVDRSSIGWSDWVMVR